jgi:hypothetical protein
MPDNLPNSFIAIDQVSIRAFIKDTLETPKL